MEHDLKPLSPSTARVLTQALANTERQLRLDGQLPSYGLSVMDAALEYVEPRLPAGMGSGESTRDVLLIVGALKAALRPFADKPLEEHPVKLDLQKLQTLALREAVRERCLRSGWNCAPGRAPEGHPTFRVHFGRYGSRLEVAYRWDGTIEFARVSEKLERASCESLHLQWDAVRGRYVVNVLNPESPTPVEAVTGHLSKLAEAEGWTTQAA
jgi:hypothetical protein